MERNQLAEFCNEKYHRDEKCHDCPNEVCHDSCINCLENIHNVNTKDRTYNCSNIAYCYTCKYIYRYSSEIEHLLETYINVFKKTKKLNICSIGCGPCSELFGLYSFKRKHN